MTEDDTYRELKKPDYMKMREIWSACELFGSHDAKLIRDFFDNYGWTISEYITRGLIK